MTFRALIFCAVSTEAQATEDKASLDVQLEQCRAVCAARHWPVVKELRVEGHSRNYAWLHEIIRDCPEYGELVRLIESEAADLVVCAAYDRLWRTDALRAQVTTLCRQHHVQVFACAQPVEPVARELLADTDTARLSEVLFGFISEQENRTRVRRRKMGMETRVTRAGLHYGSRTLYGYQRGPTPTDPMTPTEPQASHVLWMYEHRAAGWSYNRIANDLNARGVPAPAGGRWLPAAVADVLANEVYTGVAVWGLVRNARAAHPAIVPADLFRRVQLVRENRTSLALWTPNPQLLSGLSKCGHCGWACSYSHKHGPYTYMRCVRHAQQRDQCISNTWRVPVVEGYVLTEVKAALRDPVAWEKARRQSADEEGSAARLAALDTQTTDAQRRLERWNHAYETGAIGLNEMLLHRQELYGQMDAIAGERTALTARTQTIGETATRLSDCAPLVDRLDALPLDAKRQVLRTLLARVVLYSLPQRRIELDWL